MEMLRKFRNCPLCGDEIVTVLTSLSYALFDDSPLSSSYDLVSCIVCGFIFCDTSSTPFDFYKYYSNNQHYLAQICGTGTFDEIEKHRYESVLLTFQKYLQEKNKKIIDIGSAKGGLVSFLKTQGYNNLLAIDLLPECVEYMRANGIDARIGSTEKLPIDSNSVHVAILSHVLEHVSDLQITMTELSRVVVNGGLVYAEIPSIEYGCSYKNAPMWDFLYEHINYFSKSHIISLFEQHRFICLEADLREIHMGNGVVRCVYALFRKNDQLGLKNIQYHNMLEQISVFLESFDKMDFSQIIDVADERIPCYVWGISEYMQLLIAETPIGKCNITAYLDWSKYKQTKTINNIPIKSPELLRKESNKAVVIFPAEPYSTSMNKYLDEISFMGKRIVI